MRPSPLQGLRTAGVLLLLSSLCLAHGGRYPGPGDVVPPGGGGGGGGGSTPTGPSDPTTGSPTAPTAPRPAGSSTGGGGSPTTGGSGSPAGRGGGRTGGGIVIEPDLTEWTFWWEFNKDAYLRLKDAVHADTPETGTLGWYLGEGSRRHGRDSLKPTEEQILGVILPTLKQAIDGDDNRDIASSCMVAMAKIGADHPDFRLIDVFAPRLRSRDQEIRETAALAIGLAAIPGERELDLLESLARDDARGREACDRASVDYRTRTFATYGLGLVANRHANIALKARAFAVMRDLLQDRKAGGRDLTVAAIQGMGILDIGTATEPERALLDDVLDCLDTYYRMQVGAGEQLIQAHCPTTIAKLIGRDHARSEEFRALFAADLRGKGPVDRPGRDIARSCAMALGLMVPPGTRDAKDPMAAYSKLLLDTWRDHKDAQTRNFALLSLGQIGGTTNRTALLKEFDKGQNHEQAWCALALGVLTFAEHARDDTAGPDATIAATLGDALAKAKDPSLVGALAVGLGLARATDAADRMRSMLLENPHKQDMAGYLCIGLALMDDERSIEDIRNVALGSTRREQLLVQAAVALGKLGDKMVADLLTQKLVEDGEHNLAKLAAIASALGFIGDRRSIEPLRRILADQGIRELARAFAAVALGGIADKEPLPWNAKLRRDSNYRAAVETLTNRATGILDIL